MHIDFASLLAGTSGRDLTSAHEAAALLPCSADTIAMLLDLAGDSRDAVEIGAAWIIKHQLEQGLVLDGRGSDGVLRLLGAVRRPESRLHLLQSLPYLHPGAASQAELRAVLDGLIADEHTLVRAWAYGAFAELARWNPARASEALAVFAEALDDPAPSVRARIRHATRALLHRTRTAEA